MAAEDCSYPHVTAATTNMYVRLVRVFDHPPPSRGASIASHLMRQCSRPTCSEQASATLTYQYAKGIVWIDLLTDSREPHSYDLCARHAERVTVPHGWRIDDRRVGRFVPTLRWQNAS